MPTVLLVNGPNLDLLGIREPEIYGTVTLADIEARVVALGRELGVTVECVQSNSEGALVDALHSARALDGVVLNPGAYGHYSYALRDAVSAADVPVVEIHISNTAAREEFRHTSVIAPVVAGFVGGCGVLGYELALRACVARIAEGWRLPR